METVNDYLFKLIIIGDSGVGKTSLMRRYTDNTFSKDSASTIGVDFKIKTIKINGKVVKLQLWDTAGQERFKAIVAHYYRGANGILLVFDVSNKESFQHLKDWLNEIEKSDAPKTTEIRILGNKIDEKESRIVTKEEVLEFLKEFGLPESNYYEVSALDNLNIEECFCNITKKLIEKNASSTNKPQSKIPFKSKSDKKSSACC